MKMVSTLLVPRTILFEDIVSVSQDAYVVSRLLSPSILGARDLKSIEKYCQLSGRKHRYYPRNIHTDTLSIIKGRLLCVQAIE